MASSVERIGQPISSSFASASFSGKPSVSRTERKDCLNRERAVLGDRLRDFAGCRERLTVFDDASDQTDRQRFVGADQPARQEQLDRASVRDLPAQAHRGATDRKQTPARLGDSEASRSFRNPHVRRLQDFGAPATAMPSTAAISGFFKR